MMFANARTDSPPETYMKIADIMKNYPKVRELIKRRLQEMKDNLDQLKEFV